MRTYKRLESPDERYLVNLKKRLIRELGSICAGCLKKVWAPELDVYVIDHEKAKDDKNLILLDKECRVSIAMIREMFDNPASDSQREWHKWVYGGQRNPMKDGKRPKSQPNAKEMLSPDDPICDCRASDGKLARGK
jgi:hypothetical protein